MLKQTTGVATLRASRRFRALLLAMALGGGAARLEAALGVSLEPGQPEPAPVGTMITWKAQVSDAMSGSRVFEGP